MKNQHNRRLGKRPPARRLTPEQIAALREEALKWRDAWRHELAGERAELNGRPVLDDTPTRTARSENQAHRFAAAVTRAEFGRFYWSDDLAAQVSKSLNRRRQR